MAIKKRKLVWVGLAIVSLFAGYLAFNNWQLMPQPFITYGGKGAIADTSVAGSQYRQYCAGCHGNDMKTFVNHEWKFGKTRSAVFKAIKYGYPTTGMPAYDVTFSDKETYNLTDYLLKGIAVTAAAAPVEAKGPGEFQTDLLKIKIDTVARVGKIPWCVGFLPGGDLLVTERGGELFRIGMDRKLQKISGVPQVMAKGQGGLFDILPHPDFSSNQLVFISYSKAGNDGGSTTAVMQAKLDGTVLSEQHDIFVAKPYRNTEHHYGGRMVFDKKGYLFVSVGERGNENKSSQSLNNDLGKIHRINYDGSIPGDNPFVSDKKASPSIFSYGHRNPQGLTVHPVTGAVWENEHGPMGGDEINLIQTGKNYGWPEITYGINYNGTPVSDKTSMPGMEQPLHFWVPSIAPSGLAFVQGNKYKGWEGNVLSGSLKFRWLSRCQNDSNIVSSEESMMKDIGRMRDVRMGTDGFIYITVEDPGYVLKLLPVYE
jgi:aldose sugar dehydrogenase